MSSDILELAECVVRVVGDGLFCSSVGGGAVLHLGWCCEVPTFCESPGKQTQKLQTDRQTNGLLKPMAAHAPRVNYSQICGNLLFRLDALYNYVPLLKSLTLLHIESVNVWFWGLLHRKKCTMYMLVSTHTLTCHFPHRMLWWTLKTNCPSQWYQSS